MSRAEVIVVGGGLAGMSAAIRAADGGASVRLFEAAPHLGGATRSFVRDGLSYDNGQHVFMRCCTEYRRFLERIGSADQVTMQTRMDVPVRHVDGSMARLRRAGLPAPLHLSPALLRYGHLGLLDRLGVVRTALALRRLDLADPELDTRTLGTWLAEHGASPTAIDALWNLVCLPTVNLPADDASLLLAAKVFKTGLLDTAGGADIGWSAVPLQQLHADAATRALTRLGAQVRTGTRVDAVHSDPERGPLAVIDGEQSTADAIIVAVPHDAVDGVLPPAAFEQQGSVERLGRSPIVNVHLLYDRPVMDVPFLAGLGSPIQFAFDRTTSSGAPAGQQMIAISLSAADTYISWSRSQLVEHFTDAMATLLPAARHAQVITSAVIRERTATFRGAPGCAHLRPGPRTHLPGVFLAGAWTDTGWPATMEGAVRSGIAAAQAVRVHLAKGRPIGEPSAVQPRRGAAA